MPTFERGDVVRVPFPYTGRPVLQHRPALVVSGAGVGRAESLLWVLMITSAENRAWHADVPIETDDKATGLPAPSIVRAAKIATCETRNVERIGRLRPETLRRVMNNVRAILES